MAAIDKTYLNNKKQYYQIVEWCKDKIVYDRPFKAFPWSKSKLIYASDFIYKYTDKELDEILSKNGWFVLWNTPTYFDIWLIRNCPFDFIQDRLKEQYDESYELIKNHQSPYDTFKRNGLGKHIKYTKPNKHLIKGRYRGGRKNSKNEIYISIWNQQFEYDDTNDCWNHNLELVPQNSYSSEAMFFRDFNWKWFTRKLQKWNLPKGIVLDIEVWAITGKRIGIKQNFKITTR